MRKRPWWIYFLIIQRVVNVKVQHIEVTNFCIFLFINILFYKKKKTIQRDRKYLRIQVDVILIQKGMETSYTYHITSTEFCLLH